MLKPPHPDPMLEPFRGGVAALLRDGEAAGHVATQVMTFWAPFTFSLRRRWWVWYIVVWSNGQRVRPEEDYRRGPSSATWPQVDSFGTRATATGGSTPSSG